MKILPSGTSIAFGILAGLAVSAGCVSDSPDLGDTTQGVSDHDPSWRCTAGTEVDDDRACRVGDPKKTTICHVPPGNPLNAHTLCVGTPSVDAHLAHGDYLGICRPVVECEKQDPPGGPIDTPPTPTPTPAPEPVITGELL
jgi:hypothetical protein